MFDIVKLLKLSDVVPHPSPMLENCGDGHCLTIRLQINAIVATYLLDVELLAKMFAISTAS